LEAL